MARLYGDSARFRLQELLLLCPLFRIESLRNHVQEGEPCAAEKALRFRNCSLYLRLW